MSTSFSNRCRLFWTTHRGQVVVLCLAWAALVGLAVLVGLRVLVNEELASIDLRFRLRGPRQPPPEVVILALDQRSLVADMFTQEELAANPELALLKGFPLPRRVYAAAIDRLLAAGAKAVAIDVLFLSPKDGDAQLESALRRHRDRVVLASNFSDDGRQLLIPSPVLPPEIPTEAMVGYVNYWPDPDGHARQARHQTTAAQVAGVAQTAGDPELSSFALQTARRLIPGLVESRAGYIDFCGPIGTFPTQPLYELFYPKTWERNLQGGAWFRDKLVLIGPCGNYQHDQHATPFGLVDGVELHASTIATLLHKTGPRDAPGWLIWPLIGCLALVTAVLVNLSVHPMTKQLLLLAVCGGYAAVATALFIHWELVIPVVAPLWTVAGGGVIGITMQVVSERLERLRVRRTLARYVSEPVAAEILRHGDEYASTLGGKRQFVTVLFSDIRDFTSWSERSDPHELVQQLNEYFTAMVEIVMQYGGTLDKFVGDALMAVYGSPLSAGPAEDTWRAVQTAAAMRARLAELQAAWGAQGRTVLQIGIGLNHGDAVVGNIGSPQRMEYTVIGDAVNVCARVEGLCKPYKTDIVLTETVYELVKDRITARRLDEVTVKGRKQRLTIYALEAVRTSH